MNSQQREALSQKIAVEIVNMAVQIVSGEKLNERGMLSGQVNAMFSAELEARRLAATFGKNFVAAAIQSAKYRSLGNQVERELVLLINRAGDIVTVMQDRGELPGLDQNSRGYVESIREAAVALMDEKGL